MTGNSEICGVSKSRLIENSLMFARLWPLVLLQQVFLGDISLAVCGLNDAERPGLVSGPFPGLSLVNETYAWTSSASW
jgi:hypothetical protein